MILEGFRPDHYNDFPNADRLMAVAHGNGNITAWYTNECLASHYCLLRPSKAVTGGMNKLTAVLGIADPSTSASILQTVASSPSGS
jgi:hypothetical protein